MTASSTMSRNRSSGGIIKHINSVFLQPRDFFYKLPRTRHWLFVAMLILLVFGYNASNQQTGTTTTTIDTTQETIISTLDPMASESENDDEVQQPTRRTAASGSDEAIPPAVLATDTTDSTDETPTVMTSLLAATDLLVIWTAQAFLLSIVVMARGYAPHLSRSFQIAVWASLPLALMLILRQLFFSSGGEGGTLGLTALLNYWDGYSDLSEPMQAFLAIFTSNLTLFWVWNLALLYFGARYALGGKRPIVILILAIWIIISTAVPAFVSDPVTAVEPLPQTETVEEEDTSDTVALLKQPHSKHLETLATLVVVNLLLIELVDRDVKGDGNNEYDRSKKDCQSI